MKKSLNAWCVDPKYTMEETFASVSAAGFDGIELNVDSEGKTPHSLGMKTTEADYAAIRELSARYNLPVSSIASALWAPKMAEADKHKDAEALLYKQIEAALALGADGILTVPSCRATADSLATARNAVAAFLKAHRDEIEKSGIFVGLENVPSGFLCSPYDWAALIDEVGSPKVGMYFDVGNVMEFSQPWHWIEILGDRIGKVHIKDFKRNGGICTGGDEIGITKGDINWQKVMPALRAVGYDGYLVAESFKDDANESYVDYMNTLSCNIDKIMKY